MAKLAFIDPTTGERDAFVISDTPMVPIQPDYLNQKPMLWKSMLPDIFISLIYLILLLSANGDVRLQKDFFLKKVEVGTKVVLDNIYFETGKAILRPESYDALDQVFRFLENNPTMKLEISGHTDNTGITSHQSEAFQGQGQSSGGLSGQEEEFRRRCLL